MAIGVIAGAKKQSHLQLQNQIESFGLDIFINETLESYSKCLLIQPRFYIFAVIINV